MIYQALNIVTKELNQYLVNRFDLKGQQAAVLGAILSQDGSIPEQSLNRIVVSLINLEHETAMPSYFPYTKNKESNWNMAASQPYNFNLDVLVTAAFENGNYDEGLKFLSEAIYFFQRKNVFTDIEPDIQDLAFELVKLTYHEEHSLWGALGAKYMPSVLFKVRILSFQNSRVSEVNRIEHFGPKRGNESMTDLKRKEKEKQLNE